MSLRFRTFEEADRARPLATCIAAVTPIHPGFEAALGRRIFELHYDDWRERYAQTFRAVPSADPAARLFVAERAGEVVGFVFTSLDAERKTGEIGLNAVDPKAQGQGIGRAMYAFVLDDLRRRGAEVAYVATGGDAAHAPARRAYGAVGFDGAIPAVHLFKMLTEGDEGPNAPSPAYHERWATRLP